ncbi:hypothetical protein CASFOL_016677 [Castilleja foliolosa]|uniref:Uncharacterized protein n=1 Tax=Castilleja foliolosa TaxID=1961234 RepID=A0ABD3DD15_9LAMI
MTGRGRCKRRRKTMAGGRSAAAPAKIENNYDTPKLKPEITQKPLGSPKITKLPPTSTLELDLFTQARKALSLRAPFDSEEPPASVSSLPSGVTHLLSRLSDSRKRHKKLKSGPEKKSSAPAKARGSNIWVETEEYFRELTIEDVESLDQFSSFGLSCNDKRLSIPYLVGDDHLRVYYDTFNRMLASACDKDSTSLKNGVELKSDGELECNERMAQEENGPCSMDIDGDEVVKTEIQIKEDCNGGKILNSGVEWLLGSRSKIYLASERPSKKRKLLGKDAGLEKLFVARPVEGLESVCHYCSYGVTGDPLNLLIKCSSCKMVVHQRCYGVQDDVDSSWVCTWCKCKNDVASKTEMPCMLCPKKVGALKPVVKRGDGRENEGSKAEFAHLFCCQWMPEVYLENTRTMEPIMNMDELKNTRRKSICYLCKVKHGACVSCSNGSCRTSFHPICAREARNRMEIWGKLGSDEVELRAFCTKHSEAQCNNITQATGDFSLTADLEVIKLNDIVLDGEELLDNRQNTESHPENGDAPHPAAKYLVHCSNGTEDINACSLLNFPMILKKLIDLGKVSAKDVASEIGVIPDSLNTILTDNNMVPELQYKLLAWLKSHAYIENLQKTKNVKIRSLVAPKDVADVADGVDVVVPVEESNVSDSVSVKSVPPCRRTKSSIRTVKDKKSCSSKDKSDDETTEDDVDSCVLVGEDSNDVSSESLLDCTIKILINSDQHQDDSANNSFKIEATDELRALVHFLSENDLGEETRQSQQMTTCSPALINGEVSHASYMHPFTYSKLMQTKKAVFEKAASCPSVVMRDQEASQLEASSSSGHCCNNGNLTSGDRTSRCGGVDIGQLVEPRNMGLLKLSPADEVEGELLYYQQRLLCNAVTRKHISDGLISKVVTSLPWEMDAAGKRKWDVVLVSKYKHELREAMKLGRKERRHKEAQAVLAAATAAAAASSRNSLRKDTPEESPQKEDVKRGLYSQLNPRVKETNSKLGVARSSVDTKSDFVQLASDFSKDHPSTCDVCRRSETVLNPVLVCSSCKVAAHLDCYCSVKSTTGPWHCELCEDLLASRGSVTPATNSWEKPYFVAECGLCGGTAGAFRKSVDGQWIHALCAEWVLKSTYKRGQVNPIDGMDSVSKGVDACIVCHKKHGVCLKCSYGHCHATFHPTCARSAGFYMAVRTNGSKLQHKAYCEKHSTDQRAKADNQKYGIEEFKSLKQVRVELERLRLLCERIIKREKLKRELVICSHNFLASSRDSVLSALARHPFYKPEVSSESATTSIKGYTDDYKSGSEMVQRSDDITVDSKVAGKRRVKLPVPIDNDRKTDDSSTSQNLYALKPNERLSFSGKQVPKRLSAASRNLSDDVEKRSKHRKLQPETFEKELIMTSDQASMKNRRLPKGFVYVPIRCLSKDKDNAPDACPRESVERNG